MLLIRSDLLKSNAKKYFVVTDGNYMIKYFDSIAE